MTSKIEAILNESEKGNSLFEKSIRSIELPVCKVFRQKKNFVPVAFKETGIKITNDDTEKVIKAFPKTSGATRNEMIEGVKPNDNPAKGKRVAVLFSGGPAAGGHNVIAGLKKILGKDNTLLGVKAGPKGLLAGDIFEITDVDISRIQNTGGFDFLGSDRTKISKADQFEKVKKVCVDNKLDAVVIVGGDDSNTNAALLAEFLFDGIKPDGSGIQIIGVPKTIDGDLQFGHYLPISFGFDTATKVYSELAGNILQDTPSSRKYWHFIKLMGRSASHVTLEVALQTKPAVAIISEEVAEKKMSLKNLIDQIAATVVGRSRGGMDYGVVLIPEGIVEFIPEMTSLIMELNELLAKDKEIIDRKHGVEKREYVYANLSAEHTKLFASLPDYIEDMLLSERDAHGNLQVSLIPTEKLLIDMVTARVNEIDPKIKFQTQNHFFGYEGRCGAPTVFDASYTYNLGLCAGSLILAGKTGYIASIKDLDVQGTPIALPLTGLLTIERRHGADEMVIRKDLVRTESGAFKYFASRREKWSKEDLFASPGPRQLWGPAAKQIPMSVALNKEYQSFEFDW